LSGRKEKGGGEKGGSLVFYDLRLSMATGGEGKKRRVEGKKGEKGGVEKG